MTTKSEFREKFSEIRNNLNESGKTLTAFRKVADQLHSVLGDLVSENTEVYFSKKNANKNFNLLVQICLEDVPPALIRVFNVQGRKIKYAKKYKKMEERVNGYLHNLIRLIKFITEPTAREHIVKMGILPLVPFYQSNKKISSELVKPLVEFWSSGNHNLRVTSFIVIYKICMPLPEDGQSTILNSMYEAYIKNCKVMSPTTKELIHFMRVSLTEMYLLNESVAYTQAFGYMRLMAIQIRNASMNDTDDSVRNVYCWQFVHALHLWSEVLSKSHPSEVMKHLVHPLVEHAIGLMAVRKTPMFAPLVLTICKILTTFSRETKVFIPVLPHLLEILQSGHFAKKYTPKEDNTKWDCVLSVSKSQIESLCYVTDFVSLVLDAIKDYLSIESASIGFPELAFSATLNLEEVAKNFNPLLKTKIHSLVSVIKSNSDFIDKRHANIKFKFSDTEAVNLWEIESSQKETPLSIAKSTVNKKKTNTQKKTSTQKKRKRNGTPTVNGGSANKGL